MNTVEIDNLSNIDTNQDAGVVNNAGVVNKNKLARLLDQVKHEVFAEYEAALATNDQLLRLAIVEADALAHQTAYPHLVFPLLASEKAHNAARWQHHQQFRLRSDYTLAA